MCVSAKAFIIRLNFFVVGYRIKAGRRYELFWAKKPLAFI